jgi:hypothetical protein
MTDDVLQLLRDKINMMDLADTELLNRARNAQAEILRRIEFLLQKIDLKNGYYAKSDNDRKILALINRDLIEIINASTFRSAVSPYLKVFDKVGALSLEILGKVNGLDLGKYDISIEKQLAIDDIANGLLNEEILRVNLIVPVKKILYRHVTSGILYKTAEQELRQFIVNEPGKLGFAERYVKTITQELLSRYDGMVNQKVVNEFGLDAFSIVGSLIKTSAPSCVNMIRETGPFTGMAINNKYAMSDLPKIIAILDNYGGTVRGLNPTNYFVYRNHWGCRHQFIPTRFLARERAELERRNS